MRQDSNSRTGLSIRFLVELLHGKTLRQVAAVRRTSAIRKEIAFNGSPRPADLARHGIEAVEGYPQARASQRQRLTGRPAYRGFDPHSALFLTGDGTAFQVKTVKRGMRQYHFRHSLLDR